jgi:Immunoglobulin domain/Lamin Tail Domain
VAQSTRTLGTNNALPKVGPVVISEISYHPVDGAGGADNQLDEFIELANISGSPVALQNTTNTWRLRSAVDFDFPSGITLPTGGRLIVVSFNPTNTILLDGFRARWNVGAGVPFYGPYDGKLDNTGESVRLYRPDTPEATEVPYILVDQVDYSNALPWPAAADGIGPTLQKLTENAYGNDPVNWVAVGPSPGNPYIPGGTPPSITTPPNNTAVLAGNPAFFSVSATGTAPIYYQWRYRGTNIPGANFSTFSLPAVQQKDAGPYSVIVYNSAGSIESASGVLTVLIPASITLNPTNALVRIKPDPLALPTTNGTFYALASSTTPLRYQWQKFDGAAFANLTSATSSTLIVTNVQLSNGGDYRCAITDDVGTIFTQPAKLIPLITPTVVQPPLSQEAAAGGLVSVSVTLGEGNPAPFWYEWRRGSTVIGGVSSTAKSNVFTFPAHLNIASQQYRLIVTNLAVTNIQAVAIAFNIVTLADNDRDGLPDAYEVTLGLDTNNVADASLDLDGDTMSNLAEYLAGTDPMNPNSYLRVDHTSQPGATLLTVAAVSNRTYSVQFKSDLNPAGAWTKQADIPARAVNHVETLVVPNVPTNRFWRISVPGTSP